MPDNGLLPMLLSMFLVSIPLWVLFLRSLWKGGRGIDRGRPVEAVLGLTDLLLFFLIGQMGALVGAIVGDQLFFKPLDPDAAVTTLKSAEATFCAAVGLLLGGIIAVALICRRHGKGLALFGWQPENLVKDIGLGFASFLMVIPTVLLVHSGLGNWIPYEHPTMQALLESQDRLLPWVLWFSAVLVAPLYEEFYYRGAIQAWLLRFPARTNPEVVALVLGGEASSNDGDGKVNKTNKTRRSKGAEWMAILISAGVFGSMHMGQGAAPVALFLLGIALGYLYCRTGSIVPSIVLHLLLNAMTMWNLTIVKMAIE